MKVVVIGGVAGGASASARLRRLNEDAEIIILERGAYVSYANCGLPYYIGGEITQKTALTVQTPESLRHRLNLDVRTLSEVVAIHRNDKQVEVLDLQNNITYMESYDSLILSPGAEPVHPDFPGADDDRVFTLRTIPDTYQIDNYIKKNNPKKALVVGAGYVGLEMAENLARLGLHVTVAELSDHVIGPLDADMASYVHSYIKQCGIDLLLENKVKYIKPSSMGLHVALTNQNIDVDMVLLSIGVQPESHLAKDAGLVVSDRGSVVVDEYMRTSDHSIYAVGDVVQTVRFGSNTSAYIPLAGPANKQGRVAADNIAGITRRYKGAQATAILRLFHMVVGTTGLNETAAANMGIEYDKAYLLSSSHAGYYPGAQPLHLKVLFEKSSGKILGAQVIGFDGVDKRVDVLSAAIRAGMTADDLSELDLAYAPPFSSAKDPVNMIGFIIQNLQEGTAMQYHWNQVPNLLEQGVTFVDVRTPMEYALGHIEGAINIPLDELRGRLGELDKSTAQYIYCQSGQRSYLALRILEASGFSVWHLAGGYCMYASAALGHTTTFQCAKCHET